MLLLNRLRERDYSRLPAAVRALPLIVLFAIVGVTMLYSSQAATYVAASEAEDGARAGSAVPGDSTGVSGSGSVKFMAGSSPPPPPSASRDPLQQPFSSDSIWNMPIGSGAQYVPANLSGVPGGDEWSPMPAIDGEMIILKPTAPVVDLRHSDAGWGGNRCQADSQVLARVPIPTNYVVPSNDTNAGVAILLQDGRSILQAQPFARCQPGGFATSLLTFPIVDLYGQGITGAHGGSDLSSIGGSLRRGELRPGQQGPKHALKVNLYAKGELYRCTGSRANCFRWPAQKSDSYAVGFYGTDGNNQNQAMKMGVLLAIPASVNINSMGLETEPGKQLAWTLQNYGAYVVDDQYGPGFALSAEEGPDGSFSSQFRADYNMDLEQRVNDNSKWSRDMQRLVRALHAVNNNSPTSIGGGGTPRQPLAPPIAP